MLGKLFDPQAELLVEHRIRPHWSQTGAIVFVTFRTADSIPRDVVRRWEREKNDWLRNRGHQIGHWSEVVPTLPEDEQHDFYRTFNRQREDCLDTCQGRCLLRRPELAQIVRNSLEHFDRVRYRLGDFVVMPNHVHLLAAFSDSERMRQQFGSWLHYTATAINRALRERGRFWQQEPFDHLVRSLDQYEYLRQYIAGNPARAGLKSGEFLYRKYEESR